MSKATAKRTCPHCGSKIKGHPNKKFCGPKCKDRWHNEHNPRGFFAYAAEQSSIRSAERDADDDEHPFSSEALGQQ